MGYYLGLAVAYGVLWGSNEVPAEVYEHNDGCGCPGAQDLEWISFGYTFASCGQALVVERSRVMAADPPGRARQRGDTYGRRVPAEALSLRERDAWDSALHAYCNDVLGITLRQRPGWLALASYG